MDKREMIYFITEAEDIGEIDYEYIQDSER
jgi:hypothetical protein